MWLATVVTSENSIITYKFPNGHFDGEYKKTWGVLFQKDRIFGELTEVPTSKAEFDIFRDMMNIGIKKKEMMGASFYLQWSNISES